MTTRHAPPPTGARPSDTMNVYDYEVVGPGWRAFAGTMLVISAVFSIINGLVAVSDSNYYASLASGRGVHLPVTDSISTWGWVHLIGGIVVLLAGIYVFSGSFWARVIGTTVAMLNMFLWFGWLAAFPIWGFIVILVDAFVIYALLVHGNPETDSVK